MSKLQARIDLALAEVAQSHTRARHYELRIKHGTYKARVGHVWFGVMSDPDRTPLTEEQILQDEIVVHQAHIQRAEDLLDFAKKLIAEMAPERGIDDDWLVNHGYASRQVSPHG